jgi:FkbM family methyltransferase
MHVEECCQALLNQILPEVDSNRSGIAIDIGVGTFAFYCQLFDQLRFHTIAVEPLPNKQLRRLCKARNIQLLESCISEVDGQVNLYIGSFNGEENLNLNSLRPDWWGSTATAKQVQSMPLSKLLAEIAAINVTCIKIDVEGMELSIIQQFSHLKETHLPKVLVFEYGGGGTRENGQGGWSKELLDGTLKSLEILRDLGYGQTILVDLASDTQEQVFNLQSEKLEFTALFQPQSIYGNIIALRGVEYPELKIDSICQPYRDNQSVAPRLQVNESFLRRVLLKVRQIIDR